MNNKSSKGPLDGLTILEMVGLGPGPFVGMLLADLGANIIAIDRYHKSEVPQLKEDIHRRGKKSIVINLKEPEGAAVLRKIIMSADGLFEGFRPGTMEKLGFGPSECLELNPSLIYGRMTGWGQSGPLAQSAGHDINYLSITGALHAMGHRSGVPSPPLNLVGDYGAGMFLALGLVSAIYSAKSTGKGQVVDCAMVDGVNILMTLFHSLCASGMWSAQRESNFLDGGAHFYRCYETADGKFVSLGAIEQPFMKKFCELSGLDPEILQGHMNSELWPERKQILIDLFKQKSQQEWVDLLSNTDACFAPVIPFWEAASHPHNVARGCFQTVEGVVQPIPAPRFSQHPKPECGKPALPGQHTKEILDALGMSNTEIECLLESNIVGKV